MKGVTRFGRLGLLLMAGTIVLCQAHAVGQQRQRPTTRPTRPSGARGPRVQLKVGQDAPDFELVPLVCKTNDEGETVSVIGTEKVKLSDFRGKAPVCIFSSSYT